LFRVIVVAVVTCFWALAAGSALAETRVALVIGNAAYRHAPGLTNPPRDASAIAAALRGVGFATVEVRRDQGKAQMEAGLKQFAQQARGADVAVIYYAGHSLEQAGVNYIVPVDATLGSDTDVEYEAVPLKLLERAVGGATRLKLIILDSCRNNPFAAATTRTAGTRSIGRGLARVEPEADTLIAYAAREGAVASDGDQGSPYTTALVKHLATPGLEIRILFGRVRDDVLKSTGRTQEPAIYGSLGGDPFYFVPAVAAGAATVAAAPAKADPAAMELAFWQSASAGDDPAQLQAYLAKYPDGAFAGLARAKIAAPQLQVTRISTTPAPVGFGRTAKPGGGMPVMGMLLGPLDEAARAQLGLPADLRGVLVEAVPPQSEAAGKGVRPGDVITEAAGVPVATPAELRAIADRASATGRSAVLVSFSRDGVISYAALKPALAPAAQMQAAQMQAASRPAAVMGKRPMPPFRPPMRQRQRP